MSEPTSQLLDALLSMLRSEFALDASPRLRAAFAHAVKYIPADALGDLTQLLWLELHPEAPGGKLADEEIAIRVFNRIAKRLYRDAVKRETPLTGREVRDRSNVDPTEIVEQRDTLAHLLLSLPDFTRDILLLRLQGMTPAEIAKRLDRAKRTIYLHLQKALEAWEQIGDSDE